MCSALLKKKKKEMKNKNKRKKWRVTCWNPLDLRFIGNRYFLFFFFFEIRKTLWQAITPIVNFTPISHHGLLLLFVMPKWNTVEQLNLESFANICNTFNFFCNRALLCKHTSFSTFLLMKLYTVQSICLNHDHEPITFIWTTPIRQKENNFKICLFTIPAEQMKNYLIKKKRQDK